MSKFIIIKTIDLKDYISTGQTKHFIHGDSFLDPVKLQIGYYEHEPGFYLFYLNDKDEEITDTYHETVEGAIRQAKFEFNILPNEWKNIESDLS